MAGPGLSTSRSANQSGHLSDHNAIHQIINGLFGVDTDYANLTAALTATPTGGELEIRGAYSVSSPFTINKACTIRFRQGASITATSGHAIDITASGVTLEKPKVIGSGSGTAGTACGIRAVGTVGAQISDLRIISPDVSAFNQYGIYLEHVVDSAIDRPAITNIAYAGIMMLSCVRSRIAGGAVRTITMPSGFTNAYGIAISRNSSQSIVNAPRSSNITVDGVLISGVTQWEGIDTHGGSDLTITNCIVQDCLIGIAIVSSPDTGGVAAYGPQRCVVSGNTIDAQVDDGSRQNGIILQGAGVTAGTPIEAANGCVISGNTIYRHGAQASASVNAAGGILAYWTQSCVITGNSIVRGGVAGIHLVNDNAGMTLIGNTVEDAWTDAAALTACIYIRSTNNTVTVGGTRIVRGAKSASGSVNGRGLSMSTTTAVEIIDVGGNNWAAATTPTSGAALIYKMQIFAPLLGFYSATPAGKPTITGSRGGNAALASLLTELATLGLITNSTSA